MTPEKADKRIILARQTIHKIAMAMGDGDIVREAVPGYREMIADEVVILEDLAIEHPSKAAKIADLVHRFRSLARQMSDG